MSPMRFASPAASRGRHPDFLALPLADSRAPMPRDRGNRPLSKILERGWVQLMCCRGSMGMRPGPTMATSKGSPRGSCRGVLLGGFHASPKAALQHMQQYRSSWRVSSGRCPRGGLRTPLYPRMRSPGYSACPPRGALGVGRRAEARAAPHATPPLAAARPRRRGRLGEPHPRSATRACARTPRRRGGGRRDARETRHHRWGATATRRRELLPRTRVERASVTHRSIIALNLQENMAHFPRSPPAPSSSSHRSFTPTPSMVRLALTAPLRARPRPTSSLRRDPAPSIRQLRAESRLRPCPAPRNLRRTRQTPPRPSSPLPVRQQQRCTPRHVLSKASECRRNPPARRGAGTRGRVGSRRSPP